MTFNVELRRPCVGSFRDQLAGFDGTPAKPVQRMIGQLPVKQRVGKAKFHYVRKARLGGL